MVTTGELLDGRYRVEGLLGAGGMGEVFAARDEIDGRDVAVKLMPATAAADLELLARFVREADAGARVRHPNVVETYALAIPAEGPPFLVLERLRGETLEARLERGALPATAAAEVGVALLAGLAAVHAAGIIHRDVKPANVFLCDSKTDRVKLLDFGIAKVLGERGLTRTGTSIGTPIYMAPEQISQEATDERTDIYAVGATLYEALTGRPPFVLEGARLMRAVLALELEPLTSLRCGVDPELAAIIHRALAKSPELRFRSTEEMSERLVGWLKIHTSRGRSIVPALAVTKHATRHATKAADRPRRRPRTAAYGALAFVGLLVALTAGGAGLAFVSARGATRAPVVRTLVTGTATATPMAPTSTPAPTLDAVPTAESTVDASLRAASTARTKPRPQRFVMLGSGEQGVTDNGATSARLRQILKEAPLGQCLAAEPPCTSRIGLHFASNDHGAVGMTLAGGGCYPPEVKECISRQMAPYLAPIVANPGDWLFFAQIAPYVEESPHADR